MKHFPIFLLSLALTGAAVAQNAEELPMKAQPIEASLKQLNDALHTLGSEPSAVSIARSLRWLHDELKADEPEEYRLSLTQDAFLLALAAKDPQKSAELINNVAEDLSLKSRDCQSFGHGRMVSISVHTLKSDQSPDPGWRIRYVWVPSKKLATPPPVMSFPGPSSPAQHQLPPGVYEIYAERTINGQAKSVRAERVPVGGEKGIEWKMTVD